MQYIFGQKRKHIFCYSFDAYYGPYLLKRLVRVLRFRLKQFSKSEQKLFCDFSIAIYVRRIFLKTAKTSLAKIVNFSYLNHIILTITWE